MKDNFRWGLIGPGRIAERFAQSLAVIEDAELYAVASRDQERAAKFAARFGAQKTYGDYADLLNDGKVDAIYIATPHRFHFEQAKLCLQAGIAVLCEKPLTVNAAETAELVALAKKHNVFLMEALWTRFLPIYSHVRKWLDTGLIGEVKSLNSSFGFCFPRDLDDRVYNHDLAGGALLDTGIYNIAISQWVFGENPESVQAMSSLAETGVDQHTSVNMAYSGGGYSQFTCSLLAEHANDFRINGSKGHIRIHPMFWDTAHATLVTEDEEITISEPYRATGFEYEVEEAMRCIRAGLLESPGMSHADTLANMALMDDIRRQIGLKYRFE
ncbi:MAG: Gfo/Idh/MocA family oxidoreductase [Pseudomonadales bacterium]